MYAAALRRASRSALQDPQAFYLTKCVSPKASQRVERNIYFSYNLETYVSKFD